MRVHLVFVARCRDVDQLAGGGLLLGVKRSNLVMAGCAVSE